MSMFSGAHNIDIHGSTLVVNNGESSNIKQFFKNVARNAILNSGGRADEVRCYPGTRKELVARIEKWMDGQWMQSGRMMWLRGPAGAGKSAIMQTVAERCPKRGTHAANFFFFRGDRTRNYAEPLVATLLYQLRRFYPALDRLLIDCMKEDPLICGASIEHQFRQLVSSPIRAAQHSAPVDHEIILIVDGLDECDDKWEQEQIVRALHALTIVDNSPFLVLVASRAESQLVMSLNQLEPPVESIFLNSEYGSHEDIRRFVVGKFAEIKKAHHLAHELPKDWPADVHIDAIANKSSGQFIYAATVIRFIQYSPASPEINLLRIFKMRPAAGHSPFAQLDAVYSHIFSNANNMRAIKSILGAHFLYRSSYPTLKGLVWRFETFVEMMGYKPDEVTSIFADLVAIIRVDSQPLQLVFYHASLPDYLLDSSRSGTYHINYGITSTAFLRICVKHRRPLLWWDIFWSRWLHTYIPLKFSNISFWRRMSNRLGRGLQVGLTCFVVVALLIRRGSFYTLLRGLDLTQLLRYGRLQYIYH